MKRLFIFICFLAVSSGCFAQFFGPKPLPYGSENLRMEAIRAGATLALPTKNFVRPLVDISATFSNGTQLAGGFGVGFQHDKADPASNSYAIQYQVAAMGFL